MNMKMVERKRKTKKMKKRKKKGVEAVSGRGGGEFKSTIRTYNIDDDFR